MHVTVVSVLNEIKISHIGHLEITCLLNKYEKKSLFDMSE